MTELKESVTDVKQVEFYRIEDLEDLINALNDIKAKYDIKNKVCAVYVERGVRELCIVPDGSYRVFPETVAVWQENGKVCGVTLGYPKDERSKKGKG